MVERAISPYKPLFEVRLLHHYWLDEGKLGFDSLSMDTQTSRLLDYDVRSILSVVPTASTATLLAGLGCIFKLTAPGFIVAVPAGSPIAADTEFSFVVSVADGRVFDYTALTLRPQAIYEAFDPTDNSPDRIVYRYKENVSVLSNLTGATRVSGTVTTLYLSREIPAPGASDAVEALILSAGALEQLTSDNPAATTQKLADDATTFPIFVNQGDSPPVVPPAGVTGAPARGAQLSADVTDDVFALLTLTAVRGDNDAFSFVDGAGAPKVPCPVFHVRFKNRSTLWIYLDKQTGAVSATEPAPLPLTYFGNAGTRQKPSRGVVKAQMGGAKVTQLVSEIYV
jgi:hypothetical protein